MGVATTVYFITCWFVTVCVYVMFLQDARDDVGGAQNAGMLGILVRTGKKEISNHLCIKPTCLDMMSALLVIPPSPVIFQVNTEKEMRIKSTPLLT